MDRNDLLFNKEENNMANEEIINLIKGKIFHDYKIDVGEQTHLSLRLRLNGKFDKQEALNLMTNFFENRTEQELNKIIRDI